MKAYTSDVQWIAARWNDEESPRQNIDRILALPEFKELAPSTRRRRIIGAKRFFAHAVECSTLAECPMQHIRTPAAVVPLPNAPAVDRVAAMLSNADLLDPQSRAMVYLAYAGGLRRAEMMTLVAQHIDHERNTVRVVGKGNRERIIPIGKKAMAVLRQHMAGRGRGLIFDFSPREVAELFSNVGTMSGMERVHPHMLRHAMASHMAENGAPLRVLQTILGHASSNTTQGYLSVSKAHIDELFTRKDTHDRVHG